HDRRQRLELGLGEEELEALEDGREVGFDGPAHTATPDGDFRKGYEVGGERDLAEVVQRLGRRAPATGSGEAAVRVERGGPHIAQRGSGLDGGYELVAVLHHFQITLAREQREVGVPAGDPGITAR